MSAPLPSLTSPAAAAPLVLAYVDSRLAESGAAADRALSRLRVELSIAVARGSAGGWPEMARRWFLGEFSGWSRDDLARFAPDFLAARDLVLAVR